MAIFKSNSKKYKREIEKLKEWYSDQLRMRDKEIAELREKNAALLKTAMSQSHRLEDIKIKFEKDIKKKSKKKSKK